MNFQKYPAWIDAPEGHPGHPQNPGKVLVNDEDQEREAKAGNPPRDLNPPPDDETGKPLVEVGNADGSVTLEPQPASDKDPRDMTRDELVSAVVARAQGSDASDADLRFVIKVLDGDVPDEPETDHEESRDATDERTDAAGDKIAPDPAAEANKGDGGKPAPGAPKAEPAPETDARPDEAKDKIADDKPAGNVTEAAATPPEHKKGATKSPGKK